MSIPFTGSIRRSGGVISSIAKHLKMMSLKPVKKITVQFDPFSDNIIHTRKFLHYISAPYVAKTNLSCILKTNIVCDRSEPTVTCDLVNGEKVVFKCNHLEPLEILQAYNKYITVLAPPEPEAEQRGIVKLKKRKAKIRTSRHRR